MYCIYKKLLTYLLTIKRPKQHSQCRGLLNLKWVQSNFFLKKTQNETKNILKTKALVGHTAWEGTLGQN